MCPDVIEPNGSVPAGSVVERSIQERLELLDHVRQAEIRATGFRVASVVGHLIGTPLNVIVGRASLILSNPEPASVEQNARKIEEQVGKLTQRIRRLIEYLNPPTSPTDAMQVRQILADAKALYGPIIEQRGLSLTIEEHGLGGTVVDDGTTALVLLTSLLSLASRVAPAGSSVEVSVRATPEPCFEMAIPGMPLPRGRIESMEPPDEPDPLGAEHLRTLAVGSALARRMGGHLEVSAAPGGVLLAVFSFQRTSA
jgi:signal transduction histidine kinase